MTQLKKVNMEDLQRLEPIVKFNPAESEYWEYMEKRRDARVDKDDYKVRITFYKAELEAVQKIFGDRIAVERRLKYAIGHSYEWLGTHVEKDLVPIERAKLFEEAVFWYQLADETVGFLTDFALRQSEACMGAAHYRRLGGLENEVTKGFIQRGTSLLIRVLGPNLTVFTGDMPKSLEEKADVKLEEAVTLYLFKNKSREAT